MNKEEYFVNKYLEELKSLKESEKEEWLTKFFLRFENIKNKYEAISSNLPLDAAELIGEFRERKYIVSWLKDMEKSHTEPLMSAAFEYAADVISKGEHI